MRHSTRFALAAALLVALASTAHAAEPVTVTTPQVSNATVDRKATLSWTAPATYTDGAAIPAGALTYNAFGGLCSLPELPKLNGLPVTALTYVATVPGSGDYCFQVTAIAGGGESARSNRGSKTFLVAPANAPPTITVQ